MEPGDAEQEGLSEDEPVEQESTEEIQVDGVAEESAAELDADIGIDAAATPDAAPAPYLAPAKHAKVTIDDSIVWRDPRQLIHTVKFPSMKARPADRKALEADIKRHGIHDPLIISEDGEIICGHVRAEIAAALGIAVVPCRVAHGHDRDLRYLAVIDNLARKHLTNKQKRELVLAELKENPCISNTKLAELYHLTPTTVGNIRKKGETSGEIAQPSHVIGKDGKQYTTSRRPRRTDGVHGSEQSDEAGTNAHTIQATVAETVTAPPSACHQTIESYDTLVIVGQTDCGGDPAIDEQSPLATVQRLHLYIGPRYLNSGCAALVRWGYQPYAVLTHAIPALDGDSWRTGSTTACVLAVKNGANPPVTPLHLADLDKVSKLVRLFDPNPGRVYYCDDKQACALPDPAQASN